jgi:threonine 3-dehydrogenase
MSILITGGTGFIGAEIVRQLLAEGETELHILHHSGNFQRVQDFFDQINLIQADLGDHERITAIVADTRPRVIYHLGAMLTVPSEANPQASIQANAFGTYALMEAARQNGVSQLLFASSIASYGPGVAAPLTDFSPQRPVTIYGTAKVFCELLGAYYKNKFGLDFRGLRYPAVIGPGVKTPGPLQFTSWIIEECARGHPYLLSVPPETAVPAVYYKEAAHAMIQLGKAPLHDIQTVTYLINGIRPTPTIGEMAAILHQRLPDAQIHFPQEKEMPPLVKNLVRAVDDSRARLEWGWNPTYTAEAIVDDFLAELTEHPQRYL